MTIEEKIGKVFQNLLEKEPDVSFVFSYTYTKTNGSGEEIEGRTGAFGLRETVDILMEELNKVIEENTDKEDFVNV